MSKLLKITLQLLFLAGIVALALYLAKLATESEVLREIVASYGYIGIFVISVISGFNLFVPIPAISFLPLFIESGLSFWPTIFLITLGMSVADIIAFMLARAGRHIAAQSFGERAFATLYKLRDKHYKYPLVFLFFFAAVAPLPNEVILVPLAFMGYSFRHLLPVVFAGNLIFNILFAKGLLKIFYNI